MNEGENVHRPAHRSVSSFAQEGGSDRGDDGPHSVQSRPPQRAGFGSTTQPTEGSSS